MFYLQKKTVRHIHLLQKGPHCVCAKMHFWLSCPRTPLQIIRWIQKQLISAVSIILWLYATLIRSCLFCSLFSIHELSLTVSRRHTPSRENYVPRNLKMLFNSRRSHLWVKQIQTASDPPFVHVTPGITYDFHSCNMLLSVQTLYIHCLKTATMLSLGWYTKVQKLKVTSWLCTLFTPK